MAVQDQQVGQEIFLGDSYLDLGINSAGTLGTVATAPKGFVTDAKDGYIRLGMMADTGSFGSSTAQTRDVMLGGTPVETFSIGYDIGSKQYINTNSARDGVTQITGGATTNLSTASTAAAGWVGTTNEGLKVNQVMALTDGAKYVKVTITLTNTTGQNMTDLRYMRSIDPDQGPTFNTNNKIIHQGGDGKGGAEVAAYATGTSTPFFFYSQDERAIVSTYGFENRDPYATAAYDSPQAIGYGLNGDNAVNIDFSVGALKAGASTTITYYMGVTDNLDTTIAAINATASSTPPPPPPPPPVNHAPVAVNDTLTVATGLAGGGNVLANDTDADNNTLHAALKAGPAHGVVTVADDGTYKYTSTAGYAGSDSFTYTVSDGKASTVGTVNITVAAPVNHAPVAVNDALTIAAGVAGSGNVLTNDTDADKDTLHATLKTSAAHGVVTIADNGTFKYTPTAGYSGSDSFTYTVSDGKASAVGTVKVTVVPPVNHAPVAVNDKLTVTTGLPGSGNVLTNDIDADNDVLHAALKTGPAHGTVIVADDGTYKYTSTAGYTGADSFTYTVSDGKASAVGTVNLAVGAAANHAPVAVNDSLTVAAGAPDAGNVLTNDTDADNDVLHAALKTSAAHGTVIVADDGAFKYTPTAGYTGADSFTYTVSDGKASAVGTVKITVTAPTNHAPVATNDSLTVAAGIAGSGNVLANDTDADNDTLHIALKTGPAHGVVTIADDGAYKYTPATGYSGADSFTYTVSDGKASDVGTVNVTVTAPISDPLMDRAGTIDLSSSADQIVTGVSTHNTFYVNSAATSGSDKITNFQSTDVLATTAKLYDGNGDGVIVSSGGHLSVDAPGSTDSVALGVVAVRFLGVADDGLFVYADNATRLNGAIEGTLGNDTLSGDVGDKSTQSFLYDTALGLGLGSDHITNFGAKDVLVTTSALGDTDKNGIVSFGSDKALALSAAGALGEVSITSNTGGAVTSLAYDGSFTENGVTYYTYSTVGSHAGLSIFPH